MMSSIEIEGARARLVVRQRWPKATSMYTGACSAAVIDDGSDHILGELTAAEYAVEHAWIDAAQRVACDDARNAPTSCPAGARR